MRLILSVSLVMFALVNGGAIQAQDKDKKSESTPGIKEVTEIGGKTFEEWLKEMHSPDRSRAEIAIQAIRGFPNAKAPFAVKEIVDELGSSKQMDANTRLALITSLGTILSQAGNKLAPFQMKSALGVLNKSLKDPQIVVRIRAMAALSQLGPDAQGSLKELMDELAFPIDLDLRVNAINSIGIILGTTLAKAQKRDPQLQALAGRGVLLLSRATDHSQLMVRISALNALKFIGPDANEAIPLILVQLKDFKGTWEVRQAAALALGRVGFDATFQNAHAQAAQKALIDSLNSAKEPCSPVRLAAIDSLVMHSFPRNLKDPKAKPKGWPTTAPVIVALDRVAGYDPEPALQIAANLAVMRLTLSVPKVNLDNLKSLMRHKDLAVRSQAAQAIGAIGDKANDAVPDLIANLGDKEPAIRAQAAHALGRMGDKAKDAIPSLIAALSDKEPAVRGQAAQAIGTLGDKAKDAIPNLMAGLYDKEPAATMFCVWALSQMGPLASQAVPALQKLEIEKDTPEALKRAAKEAIDIITGKTKTKKDTKVSEK